MARKSRQRAELRPPNWLERQVLNLLLPILQRSWGWVMPPAISTSSTSSNPQSPPQSSLDMPEAYERVPAVLAGVRAISNAVCSVPLLVKDRRSGEVVQGHPLERLLSPAGGMANPYWSALDFWRWSSCFQELTGASFLWMTGPGQTPLRTPTSQPTQLWGLRPEWCRVVPGTRRPIDAIQYGPPGAGGRVTIPAEQLVVLREFSPTQAHWGTPSIQSAKDAVLMQLSAAAFNQGFFNNGATLGGVVSIADFEDQEQLEEMAARFNEQHRGLAKGWQWRFVGGAQDVRPLQASHKDLAFYDGLRWSEQQVLEALGVPPVLVANMDGATYNTAQAQLRQFWKVTILPKLLQRDAALNLSLVPRFGDNLVVASDVSGVEELLPTQGEIAPAMQALWGMGGLTVNEARQWMRTRQTPPLEPLPDGDMVFEPMAGFGLGPEAEEEDTPDNAGSGSSSQPRGQAPEPEEEEPGEPQEEDRRARSRPAGHMRKVRRPDPVAEFARELEAKAKARLDVERRAAAVEQARRREGRVETMAPVMARALRKIFSRQRDLLLDNLGTLLRKAPMMSSLGDLQLARTPSGQREALARVERNLDSISDLLATLRSDNEEALGKAFSRLVKAFGEAALVDLGPRLPAGASFNTVSERVLRYVAQASSHKVVILDETTARVVKERIREALAEAQLAGENVVDTAGRIMEKAIQEQFDDMGRVRAVRIARTETTGAYNFAEVEGWRQSEVVGAKVWNTLDDDRVRSRDNGADFPHDEMDGMMVALGAPFNVNGDSIDFPGDPAGQAGNVINCRCFLTAGAFVEPAGERDLDSRLTAAVQQARLTAQQIASGGRPGRNGAGGHHAE